MIKKIKTHITHTLMIPYVILKHIGNIIYMFLSLGALMLSDVIAAFTGRLYPQDIILDVYTPRQIQESLDDGMPYWFVLISLYTHNLIKQAHMMASEFISPSDDDVEHGSYDELSEDEEDEEDEETKK